MRKKEKNKPDMQDPYYGDASIPEEFLNLDDPEKLIREGDDSPDTPKKRRQNYLNRNKQYMFGAVALLLVLGTLLYTVVLPGGPDYIVGLVTAYTMPEPGRKQLEELLAAYADDRNGDGRVEVKLQTYTFVPNSSDQALREESMTDLQISLIGKECMIFLYDEVALGEIAGELDGVFQYNDGTPMPKGAADFENAGTPWPECGAFASFRPDPDRLNMWDPEIYLGLCESLQLSVCAPDEAVKNDQEVFAYYESSAAFAQRLKTGAKP